MQYEEFFRRMVKTVDFLAITKQLREMRLLLSTKTFRQWFCSFKQQSAMPLRNRKSHSKEQTVQYNTTNEVKYHFEFINNCEIKSDDQLI